MIVGCLRLPRRTFTALVAAPLAALALLASASTVFAAGSPLVGTFKITPGANSGGGEVGSYFRMIEPGGTVAAGPFLSNANSSATDQTYTLLSPGADGGLITGAYEPEPSPAFDEKGNSLASLIMQPTSFFGVNFSTDTAAIDPQTKEAVPAPSISTDGSGNLSGNLSAWGASWNNQEFNQGSPKPNGESPGLTAGPSGTYNAVTGAYTLNWTSLIVGGPFNSFTGEWHLTGTFVPDGSAGVGTGGGTGGSGGTGGAGATGRGSGQPTARAALVKRRVASVTKFKRATTRFTVDSGYSLSVPTGGSHGRFTIAVTTTIGRPAHAQSIARQTVSVRAGATVALRFTLNRLGAQLLRVHKRLVIHFQISATANSIALSAHGERTLLLA